jgi:biopolymer transport protein ExbD
MDTMRRFSQRNSLVTLSDINITPLLDLAFVLLIIFVITTPLLEQGMNLKLPKGGEKDSAKLDASNIRTVEVSQQGQYLMRRQIYSLDAVCRALIEESRRNPKLIVNIRGDENTAWKNVMGLMDRLKTGGVENYSFRTEPNR